MVPRWAAESTHLLPEHVVWAAAAAASCGRLQQTSITRAVSCWCSLASGRGQRCVTWWRSWRGRVRGPCADCSNSRSRTALHESALQQDDSFTTQLWEQQAPHIAMLHSAALPRSGMPLQRLHINVQHVIDSGPHAHTRCTALPHASPPPTHPTPAPPQATRATLRAPPTSSSSLPPAGTSATRCTSGPTWCVQRALGIGVQCQGHLARPLARAPRLL